MRNHHPAGPSRLGRIALCPGSYRLMQEAEAQGLDPGSDAASEGTLLHSRVDPGQPLEDLAPEQRVMVEKCRAYEAEFFAGSLSSGGDLEVQVVRADNVLLFGTLDRFALYPHMVRVIDWKFGRGVLHREMMSWQMKAYAIGAMQKFGVTRASVSVYQPRENTVFSDEYQVSDADLEAIAAVVEAAKAVDAPLRPSAVACQYCAAKPVCPAFGGFALKTVQPKAAIATLTNEKLEEAAALAPALEAFAKNVKKILRQRFDADPSAFPAWELVRREVKGYSVDARTDTWLKRKGE